MKHLHLVVVLVTCYCCVHVFGSFSCLGTLEVRVLLPALDAASHAEESSESSNIISLNSEIKLLNSSLQLSSAGVDILLISLLS